MKAINPNVNGDWLVVVNPNAGRRKGEKDWSDIAEMLEEANISFVSVFTQRKYQAIQLTKKHIEKAYKKIIVVGGDGTLSEVINGVFEQKKYDPSEIAVAMIPVGTGNDWCRMYQIPGEYAKAIDIIASGKTFQQDAAAVEYYDGSMPQKRYMVNMAGIGYDGLVAKKTNAQKEKGQSNPLSYIYNLLVSLFGWRSQQATITIDDKEIKANVFSLSAGINRYNGNGMKQLPFASPVDGLLDLTIIRHVGKMVVLRSVKKLFDGSFVNLPEVSTHRGKRIAINAKDNKNLVLEIDGESLGNTPVTIEVLPSAVTLIVPEEQAMQYSKEQEQQSQASV
ncbi:MAG: diacylglycerol/lipid kinase family protein [Bacteroidota bacterium]